MKTSLTLDNEQLAEHTFEVPCYACDTMGFEVPAEWIVHFTRPNINGEKTFLLCDPCLTRWRRYGFGVLHEADASWERI